jgi:acetyl/propionyl-CoA carboxylase alpha subunit
VLAGDLGADQLASAGGATRAELGLGDQAAIEARLATGGHAVEVRLNAEDPGSGFLPSTGRAVSVGWPADATSFGPAGPGGVRVDAGIAAGDVVTGRFDPLLAKVIAHGPDRATALARLAGALDATEVLGLATNLAFLRRLVRLPLVTEGRARTTSVEEDESVREAAVEPPLPDEAWAAAAQALVGEAGGAVHGPSGGAWGGGWRANLPARVRLRAGAGAGESGEARAVVVGGSGTGLPVSVDGDTAFVSVSGRSVPIRLEPPPDLESAAHRRGATGTGGASAAITAPMPGTVVAVHAAAGDAVDTGGRIATIEAMKMEHEVTAPVAGVVDEVLVRFGDQVARGDVVARLEGGA